jgi:hypothetical protein
MRSVNDKDQDREDLKRLIWLFMTALGIVLINATIVDLFLS